MIDRNGFYVTNCFCATNVLLRYVFVQSYFIVEIFQCQDQFVITSVRFNEVQTELAQI